MTLPHSNKMLRRSWLVSMLGLLGALTPSALRAAPQKTPQQEVQALVDEAFGILRDPALKKNTNERMKKLRVAVDKVFDWETMARSSLGHHWRKIDDGQRQEFITVFKDLLARQYMDDVDRFQGTEKVNITGVTERGDLRQVKSVLITASKESVPIDYTMHVAGGRWQVVDVSIEGVSLVNHYRNTFNRFLVNGDFATLLERLKRKLGNR